MDPKEPALPISYPLKTLEELQSRSYFESFHFPFNKASVPLPPKPLQRRPRMLVCHDMNGGYNDDRWVQGNANNDAFYICHWHLMDVFVYFSHYLVTLPPPCWTNTAHRHGVKVLGTFITEWEEGKRICDKLLASKESARMYADRLVELAVELGFDGWLLNMEVQLELEQVSNLKDFVRYLTMSIHDVLPGSLIIWYDSVTKDGELNWQDELNMNNKVFFDVCDGIFLNYTWKKDYPRHSAIIAGERHYDVYMGIDVFGRNTFGGGEWKTNVAVKVAKEAAVSVALFAPGWVYETKQLPNFEEANNRFWSLIAESWFTAQLYPKLLPFFSSFDQGHGLGVYIDGKHVSKQSWSNISCQSFQPYLEIFPIPDNDQLQVSRCFEHAYKGGTCIAFKGKLEGGHLYTTKIFKGKLLVEKALHIAYSIKSEKTSQLSIVLQLSNSLDTGMLVFLVTDNDCIIADDRIDGSLQHSKKYYPGTQENFYFCLQSATTSSQMNNEWQLRKYTLNIGLDGFHLSAIYAICYEENLDVLKALEILRANFLQASDSTLKENDEQPKNDDLFLNFEFPIQVKKTSYTAYLGHISLSVLENEPDFPSPGSWVICQSNVTWDTAISGHKKISLKLSWGLQLEGTSSNAQKFQSFLRYDVYVAMLLHGEEGNSISENLKHLGVAIVPAFYVYHLPVPSNCKSIKFIVQPCSIHGSFQPLDKCPYFSIHVPVDI